MNDEYPIEDTVPRASRPTDQTAYRPTQQPTWGSPASSTPPPVPPFFGSTPNTAVAGGPVTIGRRISGYFIDTALGLTVGLPLIAGWALIAAFVTNSDSGTEVAGIVVMLASYALQLGYSIYQWKLFATTGSSTGRRLAGYALVNANTGQPPGWGPPFVYYLILGLFSGITLGIGPIITAAVASSDPERRTWIDKAANLRAVNRQPVDHVGRGIAAGIYVGVLSVAMSIAPWLILSGALLAGVNHDYDTTAGDDSSYSSTNDDYQSDGPTVEPSDPATSDEPTPEESPSPTYVAPPVVTDQSDDSSDDDQTSCDDDSDCSDYSSDSDSGSDYSSDSESGSSTGAYTVVVDECERDHFDPCEVTARDKPDPGADIKHRYHKGRTIEVSCFYGEAGSDDDDWVLAADGTYLMAQYLDVGGTDQDPSSDNMDMCNR